MEIQKVRRRRFTFAGGLTAALLTLSALVAVPAQAAPPSPPPAPLLTAPPLAYVALGDSFAAGQGAEPYLDSCERSASSYPAVADLSLSVRLVTNAACGGATIDDVKDKQLKRLNKDTDVVTLTVGGNDLDLAGLVAVCLADPNACPSALAARAALLNPATSPLVGDLAATIQAIQTAAPNATIYVTGYPLLFDPNFPHPLAATVNTLTGHLNTLIAFVATTNGATYVDVTASFAGHGIGSADPWINFNPADLLDPENFHPTAAGYVAYHNALTAAGAFPTP